MEQIYQLIESEKIIIKISESLSEIMSERNLTQKSLGKLSKVDRTSICNYLSCKTLPRLESLVKISDSLNCSIDYLLQLSEKTLFNKTSDKICFIARLNDLIENSSVTKYELSKICGYSDSLYSEWQNNRLPSIVHLYNIAVFFDCSVEYLIGRTNT